MPDDNNQYNPFRPQQPPAPSDPNQSAVNEPVQAPIEQPAPVSSPPETASDSAWTAPEPPVATTPPPFEPTQDNIPSSSPAGIFPVSESPSEPVAEPTPPKKSKKAWIIGGIIAAALIVVSAVGVSAYTFVYQNPERVVLDAISGALQAKTTTYVGSLDFKDDSYAVKVSLDGKQDGIHAGTLAATVNLTSDDITASIKASVLMDQDGVFYVKIDDLRELLDKIVSESLAEVDLSDYDNIITLVDSKWVRFSPEDMGEVSEEYSKAQTCLMNELKQFKENEDIRKEIAALYDNNRFILVKDSLGNKDINGVSSIGYNIEIDGKKVNSFYKGLGETTLGKKIAACDKRFTFDDGETYNDNDKPQTLELWASQFGHELTELKVADKKDSAEYSGLLQPKFNQDFTVTAPKDFVPLKDVIEEFNKLSESNNAEALGASIFKFSE
ncbi:MAG: hypothetical protein JWN33_305 [Candidatus Saccharibacteria bacterium]|nr:hypothetical protein [Candidatus Saccharibacteria bacterium]